MVDKDQGDLIGNTTGIWIDYAIFPPGKEAMVEIVVSSIAEGKSIEVWRSPSIPYEDLDLGVMESGVVRPRSHVNVFTHSSDVKKAKVSMEASGVSLVWTPTPDAVGISI